MKTAVKKLEIRDVENLHALVIENAEGLEPGLSVLDYRLLLGHATIDAVARDSAGSLVLMAIGFTADEEMLLKAVEAYSWCLEYPDAIRRLYTGVELSESRPPRLIFVIERMPDSFHRKMKQLGFPDVDCVEFRLLEVNGSPAVYFERLARLRRTAINDVGMRREAGSTAQAEAPALTERVVTLGAAKRAATSRLQKLLTQANMESPAAPRTVERGSGPTTPKDDAPTVPNASITPAVDVVPGSVAATVVETPEPVASFVEAAPTPTLATKAADTAPTVEPEAEPMPPFDTVPTLELAARNGEPPAPPETTAATPIVQPVPVVETPIAFREVVPIAQPTPEPKTTEAEPKRVSFAEAAAKALLQQARPISPAQAEEVTRAVLQQAAATLQPDALATPVEAKPAPAIPGFEGLQFPGDGQLTRQWMEFLNQMAAAKK